MGCGTGKLRTDADKEILDEIAMLRRIRHRLTQSSEIWSQNGTQVMKQVFEKHSLLEQAYQLTQDFKCWYGASNCGKNKDMIRQQLQRWYIRANCDKFKEFKSVVKMIQKHEREILNYFSDAHTNAKAERINGQIQHFITANYGCRDKDFALYRIAGYFS